MAQVVWSPSAIEDISRLYQFLANKNQDAANRIAGSLKFQTDLLVMTPALGRLMNDDSGRRELYIPFGASFYVVCYLIDSEGNPVVLRAWHSREDRNPV